MRCVLLIAAVLAMSACSRMRLVIDAVPATDDLTESIVLEDDGAGWGSPKVALIDVTGLIIDAETPGFPTPGENPVARFTEALRLAARDSSVKALVVRINSPGGTVTASDVMHRELQHFKRETGRPIVVHMGDVAASGGYYLACAGDEIIAHSTTVTGSIGVIIQTINFSEGMRRIGIRADAITSGPNKDVGNPFEPMSEEHRALLQGIVNEFYEGFVRVVVESRPGLSEGELERITDGRVVTGAKALELGLVDGLGDLRDALEAAKRLAGIQSSRLVKYHRPLEHVGSAYALAPVPSAQGTQVNLLRLDLGDAAWRSPRFYYLWDPAAW